MELYKNLFNCSSWWFWLFVISISYYVYQNYIVNNYWKRRGIAQTFSLFPLGDVPFSYFLGKLPHGAIIKESYQKFKTHKYHGFYMIHQPTLMINDPDIIRLILVKNFNKFNASGQYHNKENDPLSYTLLRQSGEKWKRLRRKLSPAFASGKMKQLFPLLQEISEEFIEAFDRSLQETDIIELKHIVYRFTMDCTFSIAFGYNCNSLRNPEHEFLKYGHTSTVNGKIYILGTFYAPDLFYYYPLPENKKQAMKFFVNAFETMVTYRKKQNICRNDILNSIIQLMDVGKVQDGETVSSTEISSEDKLTMMEGVAQSFLFFAAGKNTSLSSIIFSLYELAFNQDVQERLHKEVNEAFSSSEGLTYKKLFGMKYLDMIFSEVQRKYPGAAVIIRICNEDFDVPDSTLRIKKGMRLVIPVTGLHSDPDYYPEPEKFDPERFTPENITKRHPFVYIPFSEGPRKCIAKRLGTFMSKMALCHLILKYKFSVCDKTQKQISYDNAHFVQMPKGDVFSRVEKRIAK